MLTYHSGRLEKVERARVSASGNPSFWFYFKDGRRVRTATDAQVTHLAENFKEGDWIRYGVNREGRIVVAAAWNEMNHH